MEWRLHPRIVTLFWIAFWTAAFTLTHVPIKSQSPGPVPHLDKLAHTSLYFCIAYLGGLRLRARPQPLTFRLLAIWAIVYLAYGAIDELTQPLTGRDADLVDWFFDVFGVLLASFAIWRGFVPGKRPRPRDSANVTVS